MLSMSIEISSSIAKNDDGLPNQNKQGRNLVSNSILSKTRASTADKIGRKLVVRRKLVLPEGCVMSIRDMIKRADE
jgi:hypothetical protein